jgi:hypothetical protein
LFKAELLFIKKESKYKIKKKFSLTTNKAKILNLILSV